jgi:hypothetical protein
MPENWRSFLEISGIQKPPKNNEIELSVFGRGFGECLVASCGLNEFVIVDSFINNETGNPIALDYMNAIGLSSVAIKQVVLTHWHQDHITGIAEVLRNASPNAKLVVSPIIQKEKFLKYMTIGINEKVESTAEFGKVIDFMKNNKGRIIVPGPNRLVFPYKESGVEIYALSPNDSDLIEYIDAIMMPDEQRKTSYSFPESNSLSIVMLIKFGSDGILLGGDLENTRNSNSGWKGLVSNYYHTDNKPSLIKIPHHGSSGAHNDDLWNSILNDKPLSVLTVFNKSVKLPKDDDINRIKALSQSLFIVGKRAAKNRVLEKKAKAHLPNVKITSIPTKIGLSRFRRAIDKNEWDVEIFGSAEEV